MSRPELPHNIDVFSPTRHPLGGRAGRLDLPRLRHTEIRFRDGGTSREMAICGGWSESAMHRQVCMNYFQKRRSGV